VNQTQIQVTLLFKQHCFHFGVHLWGPKKDPQKTPFSVVTASDTALGLTCATAGEPPSDLISGSLTSSLDDLYETTSRACCFGTTGVEMALCRARSGLRRQNIALSFNCPRTDSKPKVHK